MALTPNVEATKGEIKSATPAAFTQLLPGSRVFLFTGQLLISCWELAEPYPHGIRHRHHRLILNREVHAFSHVPGRRGLT